MSIYHNREDHIEKYAGLESMPDSEQCFYCGNLAVYPRMCWMGSTGEIFFHPECFINISTRLFRDYHEYQVGYATKTIPD